MPRLRVGMRGPKGIPVPGAKSLLFILILQDARGFAVQCTINTLREL